MSDADGDGAVLRHHVVEHHVRQPLCCLQLLSDAVLVTEGTHGGVHAEEVEVGTINLKHLLADALYEGLGSTVDRILEDLLGRSVLVDVAVVHEEDARRDVAGELHLVGNDEHGHTLARRRG